MRHVAALLILIAAFSGCDSRTKPTESQNPTGAQAARSDPGASAAQPAADRKLRIAVIPKGTTHDFWKSVQAGAMTAQRELENVEVIFRGPEREDDREQQVALVQNFISSRVDAIVLAPLDDQALLAPVRQAAAANIPVVIIDSGLKGEVGTDFISYAATNNELGGTLAGRRMGERLGGSGRVLLLRYQEGSASTTEREKGFVAGLAESPGIELIDPGRYAGATRATAQQAAENLLSVHGDINGIFCPNESSTFGMLLALRGRGQAGKVRFVGFDASAGLVEALGKGEIDALIVQNPLRMGELGVRTAVNHLRGQTVPPLQDTGVALVTRETMDAPEFRELLAPGSQKPGE